MIALARLKSCFWPWLHASGLIAASRPPLFSINGHKVGTDHLEDGPTLVQCRCSARVQILSEAAPMGQKDGFLGNGNDALAQGRSVHPVQRHVIDEDRVGRPLLVGFFFCGCRALDDGHWVKKPQNQTQQGGLAAPGTAADGYFLASMDAEA